MQTRSSNTPTNQFEHMAHLHPNTPTSTNFDTPTWLSPQLMGRGCVPQDPGRHGFAIAAVGCQGFRVEDSKVACGDFDDWFLGCKLALPTRKSGERYSPKMFKMPNCLKGQILWGCLINCFRSFDVAFLLHLLQGNSHQIINSSFEEEPCVITHLGALRFYHPSHAWLAPANYHQFFSSSSSLP